MVLSYTRISKKLIIIGRSLMHINYWFKQRNTFLLSDITKLSGMNLIPRDLILLGNSLIDNITPKKFISNAKMKKIYCIIIK